MLPLLPAAIVAAPLAMTDWKVRRLPDAFTLPAGSATAVALVVATAAGSSIWLPWLAAGPAAGLAVAGHTLAARGAVPRWCAPVSVWATTGAGCVIIGSGRLTAAVVAGALVTGVVLVAHLAGAAGFGDVKIMPIVCCAAWAAWDPVGGIWYSIAAALGVLMLAAALGGFVAAISPQGGSGGVPLGTFLPGAALAAAVASTWV